MTGPVHECVVLCGQQFARITIKDVEETVLRCLHNYMPNFPVYQQVSKNELCSGGKVPRLARHFLVVPFQSTVIGINSENRCQKKVVPAARASFFPIIRRRISRTDIEQIQVWVISHSIPNRSTTTGLPIAVRVPGLRCPGKFWFFKVYSRVARYRVESPPKFPCREIIGGHIAAGLKVCAAVPNDNYFASNLRSACNTVHSTPVDEGIDLPNYPPAFRIQREKPAIDGCDIDPTVLKRESAIH